MSRGSAKTDRRQVSLPIDEVDSLIQAVKAMGQCFFCRRRISGHEYVNEHHLFPKTYTKKSVTGKKRSSIPGADLTVRVHIACHQKFHRLVTVSSIIIEEYLALMRRIRYGFGIFTPTSEGALAPSSTFKNSSTIKIFLAVKTLSQALFSVSTHLAVFSTSSQIKL